MSVREGLTFGADVESDTAAITPLAQSLLNAGVDVRMYRDPTRGGLAATVTEIASSARVGIELVDRDIPVSEPVRAACGFLGLDPLYVANEGRLVAFVAAGDADRALEIWRAHPLGEGATIVGRTVADHPGVVTARTPIGGTRVVDLPMTEPLPRIC
jgi:hydrogenase expression/formation protein HypE